MHLSSGLRVDFRQIHGPVLQGQEPRGDYQNGDLGEEEVAEDAQPGLGRAGPAGDVAATR